MSTGIVKLRQELNGVPDIHTLRMTHDDGGRVEVWSTVNKSVRVPGGSPSKVIRAAFLQETINAS